MDDDEITITVASNSSSSGYTGGTTILSSSSSSSSSSVFPSSGTVASPLPPPASRSNESFTNEELNLIHTHLLEWFDTHRRKLPWRGDEPPYGNHSNPTTTESTPSSVSSSSSSSLSLSSSSVPPSLHKLPPPNYHNPYGTWISEVMCQQTRVDTVIPYWLRWMERFPSPRHLAESTLDEVNSRWAGLGYYRRAHNLHKGAQTIMNQYQGILPSTIEGLKSIPGIGEYTAGAIASISFGLAVPLVDGNVSRVVARLRALPYEAKSIALNKSAWRIASKLVPSVRPGDFNQALMELGATLCNPRSVPLCQQCPLQKTNVCQSFILAKEKVLTNSNGSSNSSSTVVTDIEDIAGSSSSTTVKKEVKKTKVQSTLSFGGKLSVVLPSPPSSSPATPHTVPELIDGLTPQQWKEITSYILQHYPIPFEKKKAVPVQKVTAVVIEATVSATNKSRYLMLRTLPVASSSSSTKATPKRNNGLLERQWQPYTEFVGVPDNSGTNKKSKQTVPADNEDDDNEEARDGSDNGKENDSESEEIEIIETKKTNTKTSVSKIPTSGTKRGRKTDPSVTPASSSASSSSFSVSPSPIVTVLEQYFRTRSPPIPMVKGPGGGKVNHVFSHIIHDINVEHYVMTLPPNADTTSADTILSTLLTLLQNDPSLSLASSSVEMKWATIKDFEALGLTTWTTKVLYPCLKHQSVYHTVLASLSKTSKTTTTNRIIGTIDPEEEQAWKLLHARWEKCGSC